MFFHLLAIFGGCVAAFCAWMGGLTDPDLLTREFFLVNGPVSVLIYILHWKDMDWFERMPMPTLAAFMTTIWLVMNLVVHPDYQQPMSDLYDIIMCCCCAMGLSNMITSCWKTKMIGC